MYRYGLNYPLQQVGNVSSSNVRSTDIVCVLLNRHHSRRRSHGRQRNSGLSSDITMDQLRNFVQRGSWWPTSSYDSSKYPATTFTYKECQ